MVTPTPGFLPTHVVPRDGLPAWEAPDGLRRTAPLDPLLPVQLLERRGDWGHILCANGWAAWVDGRLLVSVPQGPPESGAQLANTTDPWPLMAQTAEALDQYRRAAEELAAGRIDGETFHRDTQGLRAGLVVDGEAVWLYDVEQERWAYCDGTRVTTYATVSGPALSTATPSGSGQSAAPAQAPSGGGAAPPAGPAGPPGAAGVAPSQAPPGDV
ncbi:hypothetical protein AB0M39_28470 [Streptomyces sp. NPDC051907]|uniref:hypothetical protein n=1 Tax=Streptomyces sp. NPDC051907 TaxID=3155284 RepID=UPI00342E561E